MIWLFILKCLYFFLPAYFANMAPVLFRWIPFNQPINEKQFGKNKTWRGLIVAVLIGGLVFYLQKIAYAQGFTQWALIDYNGFSVLFGFLLGLGAILGDVMKSYYKRKANIAPGESWKVWDQLDFVIGGIIFSFFIYVPPVSVVLVLVILSPLLHILINHLAYWLKIRKKKW